LFPGSASCTQISDILAHVCTECFALLLPGRREAEGIPTTELTGKIGEGEVG